MIENISKINEIKFRISELINENELLEEKLEDIILKKEANTKKVVRIVNQRNCETRDFKKGLKKKEQLEDKIIKNKEKIKQSIINIIYVGSFALAMSLFKIIPSSLYLSIAGLITAGLSTNIVTKLISNKTSKKKLSTVITRLKRSKKNKNKNNEIINTKEVESYLNRELDDEFRIKEKISANNNLKDVLVEQYENLLSTLPVYFKMDNDNIEDFASNIKQYRSLKEDLEQLRSNVNIKETLEVSKLMNNEEKAKVYRRIRIKNKVSNAA